MDDIVTERSGSILRVELNRPAKRNAMTSGMYVTLADVFNEFGSSWAVPARIGHIRAAELILLGLPFDAKRAADLGFVTRVVPDQDVLAAATETAQQLATKRRRAASQQATHETAISRTDHGGHQERERRIQRAGSLRRRKGGACGVSGEAPA
jgi:enoyl-CoA hydratase/carnithine racemase